MNKLAIDGSKYTNPERDAIIPKIPITKNNNATFIIEKFMVKNKYINLIKEIMFIPNRSTVTNMLSDRRFPIL